ncbi:hypothetical protein Bca52824_028151 [Brassica carinata]|uniref:Tf2-1-like SH3-like domain-containing protein n=1 Tax=Brassica carinata TaxID=52824 RepID=A0A8X7VBQ6_BRACI|nr:hypothetical protein Bca52824_028151 [Brassica carinata]
MPRSPLELATLPDKTRHHGEAVDFVNDLQHLHQQAQRNLELSAAKYKSDADKKRREIGPVEVLKCINPNSYRVQLPSHLRRSNVFNVKHLSPFHGDNLPPDSWTNLSPPAGT